MQGKPAIALSLDSYQANQPADFEVAAKYCVHLVQAALTMLSTEHGAPMFGNIVNVNVPAQGQDGPQGYHLARMSSATAMVSFVEASDQQRSAALEAAGVTRSDRVRVVRPQAATKRKCALHACCSER
jgi:broad specificity polyphosphatase/5'/3'-nucleotidase SurE